MRDKQTKKRINRKHKKTAAGVPRMSHPVRPPRPLSRSTVALLCHLSLIRSYLDVYSVLEESYRTIVDKWVNYMRDVVLPRRSIRFINERNMRATFIEATLQSCDRRVSGHELCEAIVNGHKRCLEFRQGLALVIDVEIQSRDHEMSGTAFDDLVDNAADGLDEVRGYLHLDLSPAFGSVFAKTVVDAHLDGSASWN